MSVPLIGGPRPWWKISPRVPQNPFSSWGTAWCPRCKSEREVDTTAGHRAGIYTFKQTCCRCGKVVNFGGMHAPLVSEKPLPAAALEYIQTPGRDRR
jgi:hypothetical protein